MKSGIPPSSIRAAPTAEMINTGEVRGPDFDGGVGDGLISDSAVAVRSIISRLTSGWGFSSVSARTLGDGFEVGVMEVEMGFDVGDGVLLGVGVGVGEDVGVGEGEGVGEGVADGCGEELAVPLVALARVKKVPVLSGFLPIDISFPGEMV